MRKKAKDLKLLDAVRYPGNGWVGIVTELCIQPDRRKMVVKYADGSWHTLNVDDELDVIPL